MIKLELPMEPLALKHAGEMLTSLAVSLGAESGPVVHSGEDMSAALYLAAAGPTLDGSGAGAELPPPPPADVVLDAEGKGIPWDVRIHGSGKTFLKTGARAGCWKYKKGTDEALIAQVESELRAALDAAPPAADTGTPAVPPAPPAPPAAGTETVAAPVDFPTLVVKVTGLINGGRLTADQATAEAIGLGLPSYPLLATRPDLIPKFNEALDRLCPVTP